MITKSAASERPSTAGQQFDWEGAKQRLARASLAHDDRQRLSPEKTQAILEERARILSHAPAQEVDAREILEIATFAMSGERFAIETRYVLEVIKPSEITPVPGAAEFLVGVANWRGEVLAVFDLRRFFGLELAELSDHSRLIIVGGQRIEFGLLADVVEEVTTLRIDQVLPTPGSVETRGRDCLHGVTAAALMVLDGAVLLRDSRLFIDQGD